MLVLGSLGIKMSQDVVKSLLSDVASKPDAIVEAYAGSTALVKVVNKMKNPKTDEDLGE